MGNKLLNISILCKYRGFYFHNTAQIRVFCKNKALYFHILPLDRVSILRLQLAELLSPCPASPTRDSLSALRGQAGASGAWRLADRNGNFTEAGYRVFQFLIAADRSPYGNKVFTAGFERPRKV